MVMWLELPSVNMDETNSCIINESQIPYLMDLYGEREKDGLRVLRVIAEEVSDLIRRYALILPAAVEMFEEETYTRFRCLVNDDTHGITRGILTRIGYRLEESDFTPYGIYWIKLKTRIEKRK